MKTNKIKAAKPDSQAFGLVASGISGDWEVSIDETLSGPRKLFLQIDGPSCYLELRVTRRGVIEGVLGYLDSHLGAGDGSTGNCASAIEDEIELGCSCGNRVSLIWDTETNERCFILVAGEDGFHVRFTLLRDDLVQIVDAFRQVASEWTD